MKKKIGMVLPICLAFCMMTMTVGSCGDQNAHAHSLTPVARVEADCATGTAGSEAYYVCGGCKKWFADKDGKNEIKNHEAVVIPAKHDYDGVEWTPAQDGHYKVCKVCHQDSEPSNHIPGPAATESEPQTCTECGYVLDEAHPHTHEPKLVPAAKADCATGEAGHTQYYECSCGKWFEDENGDTEITDKKSVEIPAEHDYEGVDWSQGGPDGHYKLCNSCRQPSAPSAHIPGPEATESSPQVCTECGYTLADPAGHTHQGESVEYKAADCTEPGHEAYYTCSCGRWFWDEECTQEITNHDDVVIEATNHSYEYKRNEAQHWQECGNCGDETEKDDHDKDGDGETCSVCGFDYAYITLGATAYLPEDEAGVDGLTVEYEAGKFTLTLENAELAEALTVYGADAEIIVSADSSVAEIKVYGDLTISGDGKLTINASGESDGLQAKGELIITAKEVAVAAQEGNDKSGVNSTGLTVAENAKLSVSTFDYGVYMAGNVTVAVGATLEVGNVTTGIGTYTRGLTLSVDGTLTMTDIGNYAIRFDKADGSLVVNGSFTADNVIRVARITVGSEAAAATFDLSVNDRDAVTNDADGKTAAVYNFVNGSVTVTNRKAERSATAINLKLAGDSATVAENCTLKVVNFEYAVGSWDGANTFTNNGTLDAGEADLHVASTVISGNTNINSVKKYDDNSLTISGGEDALITIGSVEVSSFKVYGGTVTVSNKVKVGYFYVGNKNNAANGIEDESIPAAKLTINGNVEINDGANEFRINRPDAAVTIYGQLKIYGDKNSERLYVRQGTLTVDNSANAKSAAVITAKFHLGNESGSAAGHIKIKTNDADGFSISGIDRSSARYDLYTGTADIENVTGGGTAFGLNAGGSSNMDVYSGATVTVKNFYCVIGAWDPSTIWCGNSGTITAQNCSIGTNGIAGWFIDGNQSYETNGGWYNIQHS